MMLWPNMMGGLFGGWGLIWGIFIFVFIAIILIGIILLIIWLVKRVNHSGGSSTVRESNALEILKKRYANGEMTKEEFETTKKDIS